jgi:hypothetical protein
MDHKLFNNAILIAEGGKVAGVCRYLYTCPLDYAKWATRYGLHQYKIVLGCDSSWARCPQMEDHWKKKILIAEVI